MKSVAEFLDKVLFKSKHWQVFLVMIALIVVTSVFDQGFVFFGIVYFWWMPAIGIMLRRFLPAYYEKSYLYFLGACAILLIGFFDSMYLHLVPDSEVVHVLYIMFFVGSFVVMLFYVARSIASALTSDRATVADYATDIFFLFLIFPLGVWFIQPKLNLLYQQYFRNTQN